MVVSKCDVNREEKQKTIYMCGDFEYEYIADFAKGLPSDVAKSNVAGGCCDEDGNVYLGVRANPSRVVMLDNDGNYVKSFGESLFGNYLHFMKFTPQGNVICTDTHHHIVREFNTDGELIRDFGQYDKPSESGLDFGILSKTRRWGGIYPTEPHIGIVNMWAFGEAMKTVDRVAPPFNMPTDVDMLSTGEYVFADGYGNRAVHIFNADGTHKKTFGGVGVWDTITETPGKFLVVHALTVDANDNIWVCDREKDAVHVFDREGNVVAYCSRNMGQPSGIDTDGKFVYVIGRGGYLTIFDLQFNIVAQLGTFNCDLRAHDLAADNKGNIYLFPTHANEDHQVIQLRKINKVSKATSLYK